ncbi:hypothetical protein [Algoriphagus antarcticus]|uniref:Uncharacterized protein n=1 Tax=Algoriphagus antarcticus TaxID=238540 RepID=A0A3E0DQ78_9BACT|nr:hypothetical protein [Algoriphagus antarcticus]REG84008.1 hypothetical protein C8N25_11663 [Algoriphagus antarcticus]
MALIPGKYGQLGGSMAEAIQTAFNNHYKEIIGKNPPASNKQFELLCLAVAEGVINHLKAHPEAFKVKTKFEGSVIYEGVVTIE